MGAVSADLGGERHHHRLGEHDPSAPLQVAQHVLGLDHEGAQHALQELELGAQEQADLRGEGPSGLALPVVVLSLAMDVLQDGAHPGTQQPSQEDHRARGHRVELVGHGRAAHLALHELRGLVHVGLLEVVDVGRDLAQGGGDHGQGQEELGEAIPRGLGGNERCAEPQAPHEPLLHAQAGAAERGQGPHGSPELTHEHPRPGRLQPLALPHHFVQEDGALVAEGDGQGMLPVGAPRHHGVPVAAREAGQDVGQHVQLRQHHRVGVADLQGGAGVHDVLAGGPPVDEARAPRAQSPPERVHQRHDGVPGGVEVALHGPEVDALHPRPARDLAGGGLGDEVQLRLHRGEGGLHVQPALDHGPVIPDGPHGGGAEAVLQVEGIEGGSGHRGRIRCHRRSRHPRAGGAWSRMTPPR